MKKEKKIQPKEEQKKSKIKIILIVLAIIIGIILLSLMALYIYIAISSKSFYEYYDDVKEDLENNGEMITDEYGNDINFIEYENIPKDLINGTIAAEEPKYFNKHNSNFKCLVYSFISQITHDKTNCMKTISVQVLGYQLPYNYFESDFKELLYNLKLAHFSKHVFEKDYTKEQILAYYMNYRYLGPMNERGIYGIDSAAKYYFGKEVSNLDLTESAMISGLFASPYRFSPYNDVEAAEKRKNVVLRLMYKYDYIDQKQYESAKNKRINVVYKQDDGNYVVNYSHNTQKKFNNLGKDYNFNIINGSLMITDSNNSYIVKSIADIKYLQLFSPTDVGNVRLFLLTENGKVYISKPMYEFNNIDDFENAFSELQTEDKIIEIGYTMHYISPPIANFLVVKTESEEHLYTNTSYDEYVVINSKKLERTLKLKDEHEVYNLGKLKLDFKGTTYKSDEGHYTYILDIEYDDKTIDNTFFNDSSKNKIWSHNMAANFRVYRIDGVYILVSTIAKECFCDEVMIFNVNGEVLKTFTTASFKLDNNDLKISVSDNGQCLGPDYESHIKEYNYKVVNSQLVAK